MATGKVKVKATGKVMGMALVSASSA